MGSMPRTTRARTGDAKARVCTTQNRLIDGRPAGADDHKRAEHNARQRCGAVAAGAGRRYRQPAERAPRTCKTCTDAFAAVRASTMTENHRKQRTGRASERQFTSRQGESCKDCGRERITTARERQRTTRARSATQRRGERPRDSASSMWHMDDAAASAPSTALLNPCKRCMDAFEAVHDACMMPENHRKPRTIREARRRLHVAQEKPWAG